MRKFGLVLAVALLVVVGMFMAPEAKAHSFFSYYQYMYVTSTGWNFTALFNYNTGGTAASAWNYGNGYIRYPLPYGAYHALVVFDYSQGHYDEYVLMYDIDMAD